MSRDLAQVVGRQLSAERMVGEFAGARRDQLVIATKYAMPTRPGDPTAGGNSRTSMVRSVEGSLSRLRTDDIDLLYLHLWEGATPVEEVLRAMDDPVRVGKVLYLGTRPGRWRACGRSPSCAGGRR